MKAPATTMPAGMARSRGHEAGSSRPIRSSTRCEVSVATPSTDRRITAPENRLRPLPHRLERVSCRHGHHRRAARQCEHLQDQRSRNRHRRIYSRPLGQHRGAGHGPHLAGHVLSQAGKKPDAGGREEGQPLAHAEHDSAPGLDQDGIAGEDHHDAGHDPAGRQLPLDRLGTEALPVQHHRSHGETDQQRTQR